MELSFVVGMFAIVTVTALVVVFAAIRTVGGKRAEVPIEFKVMVRSRTRNRR